jgi:hypothetical protein
MRSPAKALGILWIAMTQLPAQQSQETISGVVAGAVRDSQSVATQALSVFPKLVTEQNYKGMGFESADEARSAALGDPAVYFLVRLDELRDYQPGSDPTRLLHSADRVLYPVLARQQVRSSVTLEKGKEGWKATSFGAPGFSKLVTRLRTESSASSGASVSSYFVVAVPALKVYFLGQMPNNRLTLTPLTDDASLGLKAGGAAPADQVFAQLVPAAKAHNGLPR